MPPFPANPTEEALHKHLCEYYRRRSGCVIRTGREHLGKHPLFAQPILRFTPDFLAIGCVDLYLEAKNSAGSSISIKASALKAYLRWEAFTGNPVFIVTTTKPATTNPVIKVRGLFVVKRVKEIAAKHGSKLIHGCDRNGNERLDQVCFVPRCEFSSWLLDDLLDQANTKGRRRILAPSGAVAA